jgi:beta-lactamase superfamily II metal-dependent hydrolase
MLTVKLLEARYGDCVLLTFGSPQSPRHLLIDGGPARVFEHALRPELEEIRRQGGKLDLVILSHVDRDHVTGLLDLAADLRQARADARDELVEVEALWHNAFEASIDRDSTLQPTLQQMLDFAGPTMNSISRAVNGFAEGHQLRLSCTALGIPINPGFSDGLITSENAPEPLLLANIRITIVGPMESQLQSLQQEWEIWLEEHLEAVQVDPTTAEMADRSIPNLSSIMLLVEAGGKRVLLPGDGRGDHLLQGLDERGLLDEEGRIHVDVFKLPHHGSARNVTRDFFNRITADDYLLSADGRYGNPDFETLVWLVEAAQAQQRRIRIHATNATDATRRLLVDYPQDQHPYTFCQLESGSRAVEIEVLQAHRHA